MGTALKTSTDGTLFRLVLMDVASVQQRWAGSTSLMEGSVERHMNCTDGTTRFASRGDEDASIMLVTPEAGAITRPPRNLNVVRERRREHHEQ